MPLIDHSFHDDDQASMAEAVARSLPDAMPMAQAPAWQRLAEVGLPLTALPEDVGGLAAGPRTFHAVAEALGRRLQASPFATSSLACTRLVNTLAAEPLRSDTLAALADNRLTLGLAVGEPGTDFDIATIRTRAAAFDGGWRIDGRKVVVLHGGPAGAWIVPAASADGSTLLFLVDDGHPGLRVTRYDCLDGSQACDLALDGVVVAADRLLGTPGAASDGALQAAVDLAELALCAESVGIQARLLEDTLAYVKDRHQFGVAIGSFQVIQHRLVDMLVALEQARSLAWLLATEFDGADADRRAVLTSAAKVRATASGRLIGLQAIHLHGGMGMTDELPIGRGVKRLLCIEHSFGDERHHLARLASRLVAATPT